MVTMIYIVQTVMFQLALGGKSVLIILELVYSNAIYSACYPELPMQYV